MKEGDGANAGNRAQGSSMIISAGERKRPLRMHIIIIERELQAQAPP